MATDDMVMTTTDEQRERAREARLRRRAAKAGYLMTRSRWHAGTVDNLGQFRLVDVERNYAVLGDRWDANLDDIEAWLSARPALGQCES